jgi:hypothetical protein
MTIKELIEKVRQGKTTESDAVWLEQFVAMQEVQRVCTSVDYWNWGKQDAKLQELVNEINAGGEHV